MLKLIIEDDEGRKTVVPFVRDEITIGRQEGNTIRLTERNVSRRHARLVRQNGHVLIEDLGSYNGTLINGERVQGPSEVHDGDLIQIGDYDLALQAEAAAGASAAPPRPAPAPRREAPEEESGDDEHEDTPPPAAPRQHSTSVIRVDQIEGNRTRKVQNLDPEKAPRLVVVTTDFKGQEFSCIRTEMRVGRTDENDITIDHRSVSATHAKIVREESGEWRVIDMQSANGLSVNGESYAQSALKHGDIIELGHVKLKFVGAGKSVGSLNAGGGSKLPLIIGLVLGLAGLGAGGYFFFLKPRLNHPSIDPTIGEGGTQAKGPEPVKPTKPPEKKPPETTPPKQTVETTPTPPAAPSFEDKLKDAREALAEHEYDRAVDILDAAKDANGVRPPAVETLWQEAKGEQTTRNVIATALKDIEAGKLDSAAGVLSGLSTKYQQKDLDEARAKLATAKAAKAATPPTPPAQPKPAGDKPAATASATDAETNQLLADSLVLLRNKQYPEAVNLLEKCLKVDSKKADCHLRLGVAYASTGKPDKGADHYRRFVELAPTHPKAAEVRAMIENYEKSRSQASDGR
ncbi:FHA domain-containing protein [Myxococcaceae bacterium GXIMD 01537]